MERRLYEAAVKGDVNALQELIQQDELILDRVSLTSFNETPLHVAVIKGHLNFAKEILKHNPQLSNDLDSRKSSPLHMAALKGDLEMLKLLVRVDPGMCLAGDKDGRNPIHLASMKGRVEVLKWLVRTRPQAAFEKTNKGETILHLCVKYNQLEALKFVVGVVFDDHELIAAKDDYGNTILHLAVLGKHIEIIRYLVMLKKVEINEKNGRDETALDILSYGQRDVLDLEISDILREAGGLRAKDLHNNNLTFLNQRKEANPSIQENSNHKNKISEDHNWLSKKRDSIMVVASLIATMAFQAGVNPTGGVWQENESGAQPHRAGESVMAYHNPNSYQIYIRANTIAFVSSLSTILILISGLPFRHKLFMWFLMTIMWLTITSAALTYGISIVTLTPSDQKIKLMRREVNISVIVWCGLMALLLLGNTIRLVLRLLKKRGSIVDVWPPSKWRKPNMLHHGNGSQKSVTIQLG
ncbi:homeodomain transcription factor [Lithospermum erythrorhizon]|uniref:Homeodomain transcription factor n=1 Tax=Lithospermum erythrorhizon TaxID=34254 RepID=A0AAV3QDH8_LITER